MTSAFNSPAETRRALFVIFAIAFLNTMGMTVIMPVVPFVLQGLVRDPSILSIWVGVLTSAYAACSFLAAPALGALSDRVGRKPVLIASLVGSAIGFVVFGIGGALWVLLLGRIIDGVTGGNISTIFAYLADITPPEERGSRFGLAGAVTGVGFMVGPAVGGLLSGFGLAVPVFVAAGLTALAAVLVLTVVPESLPAEGRSASFELADIHPLKSISEALARPQLRWLLLGVLGLTIPMAGLQSNISVLAKDTLSWGPQAVGGLIFAVGIIDIVVQGGLVRFLLPRIGEKGVVTIGLLGQGVGYLVLAIVAAKASLPWFLFGGLLFAAAEGGTAPALHSLVSRAVSAREQGWVMGALQSINSAARVIGPLLAGVLYAGLSHGAPYWFGVASIIAIAVFGFRMVGTLATEKVEVELSTAE